MWEQAGAPPGEPGGVQSETVSIEGITNLAGGLTESLQESLSHINAINRQARLLSLNARIEASRAGGSHGAAFDVVAQAMGDLSIQTDRVAAELAQRTRKSVEQLDEMSTHFRGIRLSDLALTNIDVIDRNLYERSCDVRWWATDASVVGALTRDDSQSRQFASQRLGVILDSYTVYFDLVLCDLAGVVVANGRPKLYRSIGTDQSQASWFQSALRTQSGTEFGFQSVHESPLVGGSRVLVYSCAVRAEGHPTGRPLGVIGVVFNWDGLAQSVVERVPLTPDEARRTRVCITDDSGLILADSRGRPLRDKVSLPGQEAFFTQPKNYALFTIDGARVCVAHARAPGFETYSTGWHAVLLYSI